MPERFYQRLDSHYTVPDEAPVTAVRHVEDDIAAVYLAALGALTWVFERPWAVGVLLVAFVASSVLWSAS